MIQHSQPPESDDATPEEIAAEISATRRRIDSQLHRLAQRVTPQALVHNAADKLADHTLEEAIDGVTHYYAKARSFVRKRPLGTALIALGIAALFLESSNGEKKSSVEPGRTQKPDPKRDYSI